MCLPDFIKFDQVAEDTPLIGYRIWRNKIKANSLILKSENRNYDWSKIEGPHEIKAENSGIYAYNYYNNNNYNYNNYYYNNYYNYYNNYNYYNYFFNNNYNLFGIINQWGKVALHKIGQRSEYAKIKTLFTIRESDASGPEEFIKWIDKSNSHIKEIASTYDTDTISWQDFIELNSNKVK